MSAASSESVVLHFNSFRRKNGKVCHVCGTEILAQERSNIPDTKQWRSAYDHLLSRSEYPIYAVHPNNLLPICDTCNSKAKGVKELLFKKDGTRRLCFNSYEECSRTFVTVSLTDSFPPTLTVTWNTDDDDVLEKLDAWDEIYKIRSRIEGYFNELASIIDTELHPQDYEDFVSKVEDMPTHSISNIKNKAWLYWIVKFCHWLTSQDEKTLQLVWTMIEQRRTDEDFFEEFGR